MYLLLNYSSTGPFYRKLQFTEIPSTKNQGLLFAAKKKRYKHCLYVLINKKMTFCYKPSFPLTNRKYLTG